MSLFPSSPKGYGPHVTGLVRSDHPDTSRDAAKKVGIRIGDLHRKLMDLLRTIPDGLTDEQMQDATGMNPSTQRPRRVELVDAGLVVPAGGTRKTKSGSSATVWTLKGKP